MIINKKTRANMGDERTITVFTFIPRKIGSKIYWLENITIDQMYVQDGCADVSFSGWVDIEVIKRRGE